MLRVLIIRPGALGDTLMLVPALEALSGKVNVTFVGRQPGLDFIRPHVDYAMDLEASGWHRLFMDQPDREGLPVSDMDIVAAFFSDGDGVIRHNLRSSLPHAVVKVFPSFPSEGENIHVAEYLARCLKSAGLPVDPVRSIQAIQDGVLCEKEGPSKRRNKIVLHPGSGSLDKNHPPGFWIELATRFGWDTAFNGFDRVFLLGPAEESIYECFHEDLRAGDVEILLSSNNEALMEILDEAALCLGHDSGITHLSAMWCVPTIALFKKSNPTQWAPLGPFVHVINNRDPGAELIEEILEAARGFFGMDEGSEINGKPK